MSARFTFITLLAGISFCGIQRTLAANSPKSATLTMEQAIAKARDHSPEIKGLHQQWSSAQAKASQSLAPYEPTLTMTYQDMQKSFDTGNPASTVLQVQQQLGFPGRAYLTNSSLSYQAQATEAQLHAMELQVIANTKSAYLALSLAQQNLALNRDQTEAYGRILEIAKRRYASGTIPQVDLINAQIAQYSNSNDLNDLQAAERSALAQLNTLIGNPLDQEIQLEPFKSARFPLPSLEEAEKKMLAGRHELKAARYQLLAADDGVRLAKWSLLPDLFLTGGMTKYNFEPASPWSSKGAGFATTTYSAGLQITIPIFGLFNERQAIRSASFDRANADANLQIALNQSRVQLKTTLETLRATEQRLENNEQHLLPLSEQALSLALINYSAGKIDFQTLVDTASSRRNIRRDYLTAVVNYLNNYATLGQLLGEEL